MADRNNKLRLGVFTAGSMGVLAALTVLFGGAPNLLSGQDKYTVMFSEAPGLGVGMPVRKSGVRIGQVTQLELDEESGMVKVSVAVDPKYRPRSSEEATITRGLLNGDTALDFLPKVDPAGTPMAKGEAFEPNSVISGVPPVTARNLLKGASDVIPTAQENVTKVVLAVQRFERAVPKIEAAVDEIAMLARAGREFVPELRKTNVKVQELLGTADDPKDEPVNIKALIQRLLEVLTAIRPAAEEIRDLVKTNGPEVTKTLSAVRKTAESADDLLNPENRKTVAATLKNVQSASDDLVRTIRVAALLMDQAEKSLKEIQNRIAQSEKLIETATKAADNVERATKPIADNAAVLVGNFDTTIKAIAATAEQLNKAVGEIRITLNAVNQGNGTVGKALNDPTIYNNLNESIVNVARVMARLEKVAKDLEVFADKIARRPETIGVGGALRPNTGLKESPTAPLPTTAPLPIAPNNPNGVSPAIPISPGAPGTTPLMPIPPVPFTPNTIPGQTVQKPPQ